MGKFFKRVAQFFSGKDHGKKPNFDEMRRELEERQRQLQEEQKRLKAYLEALEKEKLQNIEILKKIASSLVEDTKAKFAQILNQDKVLSEETEQFLIIQEQEHKKRTAKIEQIKAALKGIEEGKFEGIEALSKDNEALELFPSQIAELIIVASKSGRKEWSQLQQARKLQVENERRSDQLKGAIDSVQKILASEPQSEQKVDREIKEVKEFNEGNKIIRQRRNASMEERILGLVAFELAIRGKLHAAGGTLFVKEEDYAFLQNEKGKAEKILSEFDSMNDANQKLKNEKRPQGESLGEFAQNVLGQFSNVYDFQFLPSLQIALAITSVALIAHLKQNITPDNQILVLVEAALAAGLSREFVRASIVREHDSGYLEKISALITKLPWREQIASYLKIWDEKPENREKIINETSKLFDIASHLFNNYEISYKYRDAKYEQEFYNISTLHYNPNEETRNSSSIKNLILNYIELMQKNTFPIGSEEILTEVRKRIRISDLKKRTEEQELLMSIKEQIGQIAFKLHFKSKIRTIFEIQDKKTKNEQFQKEFHEIYNSEIYFPMLNNKPKKYEYFNYEPIIKAVEDILTQIIPVVFLEPEIMNYDFDLLPVAMALAKIKVIKMITKEINDNLFSEEKLENLINALLYAGYVRKMITDFPEGNLSFAQFNLNNKIKSLYDLKHLPFCSINYYPKSQGNNRRFSESASYQLNPFINITVFECCNFDKNLNKHVDLLLDLKMKPFLDREAIVQKNPKYKIEMLKQTDLMDAYLSLMNAKDFPNVYDDSVFLEAQKGYQAISKMRVNNSYSLNKEKILEATVFKMILDNQFYAKQKSLENDLMKLLSDLKITITDTDSRLGTFREDDLLRLSKEKGIQCQTFVGKNHPKSLLYHVKYSIDSGIPISSILKRFGVNVAEDDAKILAFKKKFYSLESEINYLRQEMKKSNENVKIIENEKYIEIAANIINQMTPYGFDLLNGTKAFALASVGVSYELSEKGKNKKPEYFEDSLLVEAIVYAAMIRVFYNRRTHGWFGNGYGGVGFSKGRNFLELSRSCINYSKYEIKHEELEGLLVYFLHEFRDTLLGPYFTDQSKIFLELSKKTRPERDTFVAKQDNDYYITKARKEPYYINHYSTHKRKWVDLRDECDVLYAYRKILETHDFSAGDIRILNEAETTAKILGERTSMQQVPYEGNLPLVCYSWETQEIQLRDRGKWQARIINLELFRLQTRGTHSIFKVLQKHGITSMQALLRAPMLKNIFLEAPPNLMILDNYTNQPALAQASRELVPYNGMMLNPNQKYMQEQGMIAQNGENDKIQIELDPGTNVVEFEEKDGTGYYLRAIDVPKTDFLKTPLQDRYIAGQKYRLEFKSQLSGSLTLQQEGEIPNISIFNRVNFVEFIPEKVGPLNITISLANNRKLNVQKNVNVLAPTALQKFKQNLQQPNWDSVSLKTLRERDGITFTWNEQRFFKIKNTAEMFLWEEERINFSINKELYENYLSRLAEIKNMFLAGTFEQRMKRMLLSSHWLLSKDLMFAPFFILGCSIYYSEFIHLEDTYFDLLSKQIALYELMLETNNENVVQFIEHHKEEFPKYWSNIFKSVHEHTDKTLQGFLLLVTQCFLTVLKEESFNINCSRLLEMTRKLYDLKNKEHYQQSRIELEEEFSDLIYSEWATKIYERWGGDLDAITQAKNNLHQFNDKQEETYGEEQARFLNAVGRRRTAHVECGTETIENCLEGVSRIQNEFEFMENSYANNRTKINQAIVDIQNAIAQTAQQIQLIPQFEREYQHARRKAKHKHKMMMIKSLVGIALSAFLGPMLTQLVVGQLAKVGVMLKGLSESIVTGAINGAFSSGIQSAVVGGQNITKSMLQGLTIGGVTGGLEGVMSLEKSKYFVESLIIKETLKASAGSVLDTAMNGGKLLDKLALDAGTAAAINFLLPDSNKNTKQCSAQNLRQLRQAYQNISIRELVKSTQKPILRSFASTAIRSAVKKTPMNAETLIAAALGAGIQTLTGEFGQNIVQKMRFESEGHANKPRSNELNPGSYIKKKQFNVNTSNQLTITGRTKDDNILKNFETSKKTREKYHKDFDLYTKVEQYRIFIKSLRDNNKLELTLLYDKGFVPDYAKFLKLTKKGNDLYLDFYNQIIAIHYDSAYSAGHIYLSKPLVKSVDSQKLPEFFGFYPKHNGLLRPFGPGLLRNDSERAKQNFPTVTTDIYITEEQCNRFSTSVNKDLIEPRFYNILGKLFGNNCATYVDKALKDIGIVDGLIDKFDPNAIAKHKNKPIKIYVQTIFRFDKLKVLNPDAAFLVEIAPLDIYRNSFFEAQLCENAATKRKEADKNSHRNATMLFWKQHFDKIRTKEIKSDPLNIFLMNSVEI